MNKSYDLVRIICTITQVYMIVCMYVGIFVCMYVCMYVCTYVTKASTIEKECV